MRPAEFRTNRGPDFRRRTCRLHDGRHQPRRPHSCHLAGGYNSGKTNTTNNLYLNTEDGINRVAIRSTLTPGTIKVTATRDGLKPATVTFTSSPVAITGGLSQEVEVTLSPFATK